MRTPIRPMISVAATSGLVEAIRAAGANPDQVLRMFQLDPSVLSNTEKFIPCPVFARILEEAAGVTGDDCFGLHLGERFNPKNIGPLCGVHERWRPQSRAGRKENGHEPAHPAKANEGTRN